MNESEDVASLVTREWTSIIEPLLPLGERLSGVLRRPEDAQLRHEYYRALICELAVGYFGLLYADARHPDFWPLTTPAFNGYLNNPDDDYYLTPVEDDGIYKISGFRGTVKTIDFQTGSGTYLLRGVADEHNMGLTHANYDLDEDATIAPDGSFEVILSRERPPDWDGDWWQLHDGTTNILSRQISYDWPHEVDGRYGIERLDLPAAKPRPSAARLADDLGGLAAWVEGQMRGITGHMALIREKLGVNVLNYLQMPDLLAIPTQAYVYGGFDLQPDEALVVEFRVPRQVRYWSFHLGDDLGFMLDWVHHHTIINGHTAVVGPDRTCHVVVSAQDPGVPNWLDTMGYQTGALSMRWERCDRYPDEHQVNKVNIAELRAHLPSDIGTVSPEERDKAIRLRRKGAQMRKRW